MQAYQYIVQKIERFKEKELDLLCNRWGAQGFRVHSLTPLAEAGFLSGAGGTTSGVLVVFERPTPDADASAGDSRT